MKELKIEKFKKSKRLSGLLLYYLLLFMFIAGAIVSGYIIFSKQKENKEIKAEIASIQNIGENSNEINAENNSAATKDTSEEPVEASEEEKKHEYNGLKTNDFSLSYLNRLKKLNSETVGLINIPGTNVKYPTVKAKDNDYYLKHSFFKKPNSAGWVFMDFRNNPTFTDYNTILYGHANLNKTMFGSLKYTLNPNWAKTPGNGKIEVLTERGKTNWEIFSIYTIKAEEYYIKTYFNNNEEYNEWRNTILKRNTVKTLKHLSPDSINRVLTLSTCYKSLQNIRLVIHAARV